MTYLVSQPKSVVLTIQSVHIWLTILAKGTIKSSISIFDNKMCAKQLNLISKIKCAVNVIEN